MNGEAVAIDYLRKMALEQIDAGAAFLDVNVDELSHRLPEQIAAMEYLVDLVGLVSTVPPRSTRPILLVVAPVDSFTHAASSLPVYVHLNGVAVWL